MKVKHRLPIGQTVVFNTYTKHMMIGKVIDVRPVSKRLEYTVYGENGKVYENLPNSAEGMYRIDANLTKQYCKKNNIKVDEIAAEQAEKLRKIHVVVEAGPTDAIAMEVAAEQSSGGSVDQEVESE